MRTRSIRAFIGTRNYQASRAFYRQLGFEEMVVGDKLIYFKIDEQLGFYLQDYYVKDWVDNSMVFLEVEDLDQYHAQIAALKLESQYAMVRLSAIQELDWGREFFLHDPSGVLWHIGSFK